ncbi:MAG: DUF3306 domain-containing protein [Usitatibacter sp.]
MSDDFLSRWSRLKRAKAAAPAVNANPAPVGKADVDSAGTTPAAIAAEGAAVPQQPQPLPPVESLSFESDFTAFMRPEVGEVLKRQALKTLFRDPRFNVMDGLDVYIDDFSKADPLPEGWLEKMTQMARLGDYQPPPEEAPAATDATAEEAQKEPQNEALATPEQPAPSDTLEAPGVAPRVIESPPAK